jgi:hypothetical protein
VAFTVASLTNSPGDFGVGEPPAMRLSTSRSLFASPTQAEVAGVGRSRIGFIVQSDGASSLAGDIGKLAPDRHVAEGVVVVVHDVELVGAGHQPRRPWNPSWNPVWRSPG